MRALVTGANGQDGVILAGLLAASGVETFGLVKPGASVDQLLVYAPDVTVIEVDLIDPDSLHSVVREVDPTHVWNFGGFTAPGESWDHAAEVEQVNVDAVSAIIAALVSQGARARLFQASSATVFEGSDRSPQTETTEFSPKSPYAKSKARAMELVRNARSIHGLFACSGIFYNHESPLRGENFVTRKVSMAVARIAVGLSDSLELGDIEVARDWGWAPDYVRATMLILSANTPRDFVLATGISHRLSFFVSKAFAAAGITNWRDYVVSTASNTRAGDTNLMVGDSRLAHLELGWRHTIDFDAMASVMVGHDMALLRDPEAKWGF
jgi:GDPmannose 4,6-dehydratase